MSEHESKSTGKKPEALNAHPIGPFTALQAKEFMTRVIAREEAREVKALRSVIDAIIAASKPENKNRLTHLKQRFS